MLNQITGKATFDVCGISEQYIGVPEQNQKLHISLWRDGRKDECLNCINKRMNAECSRQIVEEFTRQFVQAGIVPKGRMHLA